jgi:hypothetical protein
MRHYDSFWVVSALNLSVVVHTETLRILSGCDEAEIVLESDIGRRTLIGSPASLQRR